MKYKVEVPQVVKEAALFPYEVVYLGKYKENKVYGYRELEDDGRGIGLPHVIVYDGKSAQVFFERDNDELSAFFD